MKNMLRGFQKGNKYRFQKGSQGFKGPHSEATKQIIREKRKFQINTNKGKHWKEKDTSNISKSKIGKPSGAFGKHWKIKDTSKYKGSKKGRKFKIKDTSNMKNRIVSEITRQKLKEAKIMKPNKLFSGTKIELKMRAELNKRSFIKDVDYYCNVGLCKVANVDIYLPAHNIVIECDGCYYHNCPIHYPEDHKERSESDARKTAILTYNGFNVYRFWEHEINKSVKKCVDKIYKDKLFL